MCVCVRVKSLVHIHCILHAKGFRGGGGGRGAQYHVIYKGLLSGPVLLVVEKEENNILHHIMPF